MSYRTLIEINHDFCDRLTPGFVAELQFYLRSASRESAEALERYGIRVIGMRHHSGNFILDGTPDGFPVQYLVQPKDGTRQPQGRPQDEPPSTPPPAVSGETLDAELIERAAEKVYAAMVWTALNAPGKPEPTWFDGGNSHAQTEARRAARYILALAVSSLTPVDVRGDGSSVAGLPAHVAIATATDAHNSTGKED